MPHELIYTSSPRGLKAGATGYCTVAHTPNLPTDLANQLEGISHYRHLQVGSSASESANPVAYAHSVLTTGYTVHHVVSRVADSGLDHSGRSNFLAHHVAFGTDSLPDVGPAWLCGQRFFVMKWDRAAGLIPDDRSIPSGQSSPSSSSISRCAKAVIRSIHCRMGRRSTGCPPTSLLPSMTSSLASTVPSA